MRRGRMLARAGIPDEYIVDVKDHPLLPGEHATRAMAAARANHAGRSPQRRSCAGAGDGGDRPGCYLEVGEQQRADLEAWLQVAGSCRGRR